MRFVKRPTEESKLLRAEKRSTRLGINIDHVATLRQARREGFPDPVALAIEAVSAGADGITAHLREDRRHINDDDIRQLKETLSVPLNMEMSIEEGIIRVAEEIRPSWVCLVPERRQELTTEGGLDVQGAALPSAIERILRHGIQVSLFVDPKPDAMREAKKIGANAVELHTGGYARAFNEMKRNPTMTAVEKMEKELGKLGEAAAEADRLGMLVNAGHGISYENVSDLVKVFPFNELNIGFSVIARALQVGLSTAVRQMKEGMS